MSTSRPRKSSLSFEERAALWDGALSRTRSLLRERGLREVLTPVRVRAPAIEPWIEPLRSEGAYLATSPELSMKRLLVRGVRDCFQVATVFRAGERGDWHREEFHLCEWYRVDLADPDRAFAAVMRDVELLVAAIAAESEARSTDARRAEAPARWEIRRFEQVWEETGAGACPPDDPDILREVLAGVSGAKVARWPAPDGSDEEGRALASLAYWTELFSWWSDAFLDPWLEVQASLGVGIHLIDFPAPLAALSRIEGGRARRFESYLGRVELANGYLELADSAEQRRRFGRVNALRELHGQAALPLDEAFVQELDNLPPCAGVALGFDRLVAWSVGADSLADVELALGAPS